MPPADPLPFPRSRPPASASVLSRWLDAYGARIGVAGDRLRRMLAFEFLVVALDRHRAEAGPVMVIKGGMAIEARLRLNGRATRDIDAILRGGGTVDEIDQQVREALVGSFVDGAVTFEVRGSERIGPTDAVRFDVRVHWRGRALARLRLEVGPEEGAIDRWDEVEPVDLMTPLGIPEAPASIPCLPIPHQMAQKLHAVTLPLPANDRYRDLADLLLLDGLLDPGDDGLLAATCRALFSERDTHPWPPAVVVRDGWASGYRQLAAQHGLTPADVEAAAAAVRTLIARIAGA